MAAQTRVWMCYLDTTSFENGIEYDSLRQKKKTRYLRVASLFVP